jgi:hypothetical protein
VLGRLAAAEQRLSEAEQSGLEQAAAAGRLEAEKAELAERLAAAQVEVAGLEAQLEVARLELEEKFLKLGTKIQVRQYPIGCYSTVYCHKFIFYMKQIRYLPRQISQFFNLCQKKLRIAQQCQGRRDLRNFVLYPYPAPIACFTLCKNHTKG